MNGHKNTRGVQIEYMPSRIKSNTDVATYQHSGYSGCKVAILSKRTKIGDIPAGLGCPIRSSVSGKVTAITTLMLSTAGDQGD